MISVADYKNVVCLLDSAISALSKCSDSLTSMNAHLTAISTSPDRINQVERPILDLLAKLKLLLGTDNPNVNLFVQALQKHVTTHYGSVTLFLTNNSIKIPPYVAGISQKMGYPIPASLIANC